MILRDVKYLKEI